MKNSFTFITTVIMLMGVLSPLASVPGGEIIQEQTGPQPMSSHPPIRINNDTEFAATAILEGWFGTGTSFDPYIIQDYTIDASGSHNGIYIGNTTVYFIIRNCTIQNASPQSEPFYAGAGITLFNVTHGTVTDIYSSDNHLGTFLYRSYGNELTYSNLTNNRLAGLMLRRNSDRNNISHVDAYDNNLFGIGGNGVLINDNSDNNTLENLVCKKNDEDGVRSLNSRDNFFYNTTAKSNSMGMHLVDSDSNEIMNSTLVKNTKHGLFLESSNQNYIDDADCSFNGGRGIYLDGSNFNGMIFFNCENNSYGLYVNNSHVNNFILGKCFDNDPFMGILIRFSHWNVVERTNSSSNGDSGVYMYASTNNTIKDNTLLNGYRGVVVRGGRDNIIEGNNCSYDQQGIRLQNSNYNRIRENEIYDSGGDGIYAQFSENNLVENNGFSKGSAGIHMVYSNENEILNNTGRDNNNNLFLEASNDTVVDNNTCVGNSVGILSLFSARNDITNNTLRDNFLGIFTYTDQDDYVYNNSIFNNVFGAYVENSTDQLLLKNQLVRQTYSIHVNNSIGVRVVDNHVEDSYFGVNLNLSEDIVIKNNSLKEHIAGIYIKDSLNNDIFNNEMINCSIGMEGKLGAFTTQTIPVNNTINGKIIYYFKNQDMGGYVVNSDAGEVLLGNVSNVVVESLNLTKGTVGVEAGYSDNIYVANNSIKENLMGVAFLSTNNSVVRNNSIVRNIEYGVLLEKGSQGNQIYWNSFLYNNGAGDEYNSSHIQAKDTGGNNRWNLSYPDGGNYWSDWTEPDVNTTESQDVPGSDGIVDEPYLIEEGLTYDYFPRTNSTTLVISTPPRNLTAESGDGYANLSWDEPSYDGGSNITEYRIYRGTEEGNLSYLDNVTSVTFYNDTGLVNGVTYYYNVTAVNAVGESNPANTSALPLGPPSPPVNLQEENGYQFVNISWNMPLENGGTPVTGYNIYRNGTAGVYDTVSGMWYNDTNVINGVVYHYNITAVNAVGESDKANISSIPGAPPYPPVNINAVGGDAYVNLTWDAPTDDGGFAVTDYNIYKGTSSGDESFYISVSSSQEYYNDTTVANGQDYFYYVTAVNSRGESSSSSEVSATPMDTPTSVRNLAGVEGDGYLNLTWDQPSGLGGEPLLGYNIYRNGTAGVYQTVPPDQRWFNDTDVVNGLVYTYNVTAENSAGESTPKSISLVPGLVPDRPVNLTADGGDGFVELDWDEPPYDGGMDINQYWIYRGMSSGNESYYDSVSGQTNYTDDFVVNGETYHYYVTALNNKGESSASEGVIGMPGAAPSSPINLKPVSGNGYVELSWEEPTSDGGYPITRYNIYRGTASGNETYLDYVEGAELSYNDTSVVNGMVYYYYVTAENTRGESFPSGEVQAEPVSPYYEPGIPRNVSAVGGVGYVNLTWNPPEDTGNREITGYRIFRGTSLGDMTMVTTVPVTYYNDTDVEKGTEYYYQVMAVNSANLVSDRTEEVSALPTGVPDGVVTLEVSSGDSYVNLTWAVPENTGGLDIVGYRVYKGDESGAESYLMEVDTTWFNDTDVVNEETYYYQISAVNSVGESVLSDEVSATPSLGAVVPGAPTGLTGVPRNGHVNISWDAPSDDGGAEVTGYYIYKGMTSGELEYYKQVSGKLYFVDEDVENEVDYYYSVSAVNKAGEGDLSAELNVVPDGKAPSIVIDNPKNGTQVSSEGITIQWSGSDDNSGICHYEVRLNDGSWINVSDETSFTFDQVPEGSFKVSVRAYDRAGNYDGERFTYEYVVDGGSTTSTSFMEDYWWVLLVIALASGGAVGGLWYTGFLSGITSPVIEDVFLISHDALLIAHNTRRLKPDMDDDILAGMLTAVQNFIKDSFKDEEEWMINKLEFADKKILVERGKYTYMAVIYEGELEGEEVDKIQKTIKDIEEEYEDVLKDWDGNMEGLRGVKDMLKQIF